MNFPKHACGLYLHHNEHKDVYRTVQEFIDKERYCNFVSEEQQQKAILTNECWELQWYPDTPIGSYTLCAADLNELLKAANEVE